MKTEVLVEKVRKAEEKVEKVKGTISRHEKQLEKKINALAKKGVEFDVAKLNELKWNKEGKSTDWYWEVCEIESKISDIKNAKRKLEESERILEDWKVKLSKEKDKESFVKFEVPQVILDFLEEWKNLAYEWHVKRYEAYPEFRDSLDKLVEEAKLEAKELGVPQRRHLSDKGLDYLSIQKKKSNFCGAVVLKMLTIYSKEERLDYLNNVLEEEKKAKIITLVNRIKEVVGTIEDAKGLRITNGNLNGIIVGDKGTAKVETIGAGGYNIQCFHFRTLVTTL